MCGVGISVVGAVAGQTHLVDLVVTSQPANEAGHTEAHDGK